MLSHLRVRITLLTNKQAFLTHRTPTMLAAEAGAPPGKKTHQNRGGYDCEFATQPPDAFQTECPICLLILKEPCVISCPCGQKICRECIEKIKESNKPCPLCNKTNFTFMRDYGLERFLKEQEVWCSHKKDGCERRGKLGEYEQHLNEDPSPENQLTGCQFVEVGCKHGCGKKFQRHHIIFHQNQACPERPYSCEYCHQYHSTFEDITKNHYPQCVKYPVGCPNKCQEAPFERQNIDNHVKDECPLTEIHCPLHYAGCKVRLPRKDMPDHMSDTVTHLTLLATVTQSLLQENLELRQITEDLQRENRELRQEVWDLTAQSLVKSDNELFEDKQSVTRKEVETLREEMHQMKLMLGGFPIDFHMKYEREKKSIYSPSFFTHLSGYQMCIELYPNGIGDGKGTHVTVSTFLMRGPYDGHLKWPFRGEITVQIVNQAGDHSHVENTIQYNDKTPDDTSGRVVDKERGGGWGFHFLPLTDLEYNTKNKTQYLKDDIMIVRVVSVVITQ